MLASAGAGRLPPVASVCSPTVSSWKLGPLRRGLRRRSRATHAEDRDRGPQGAGGKQDHRPDRGTEARRSARTGKLGELVVDYAADPEACYATIGELLEEYEAYLEEQHASCPDCPVWRSGNFIAGSLLEWKAVYSDGRLSHWTRADIAEYLLDHFPRKISAGREVLADTPACVRDLIYFLSDCGTLSGDALDELATAGEELYDQFLAANRDRRNWGLAKSFVMDAHPSLDGPGLGEGPGPIAASRTVRASVGGRPRTRGPSQVKRAKRKAARTARRRNRR
jgi:hypothetical protein